MINYFLRRSEMDTVHVSSVNHENTPRKSAGWLDRPMNDFWPRIEWIPFMVGVRWYSGGVLKNVHGSWMIARDDFGESSH